MIGENQYRQHLLLKRTILFIILPLIGFGFYLRGFLLSSLPDFTGKFYVSHIGDEVTISRDEHGVPSIVAQSDQDAFFAMGYVHAQDRLWQLEFQRRLATGRLSEVFGYHLLTQDKWMRTLGLRQAAELVEAQLSPSAKASLQAYAEGVNTYLAQVQTLPPEFGFLGIKPEPWQVLDSLTWVKFFALSQAKNINTEVHYHLAQQGLSSQHVQALFPGVQSDGSQVALAQSTSDALKGMLAMQKQLETEFQVGGKNVGSNAWVVSGSRSASKRPILANDPHLGLQIPSLWYTAAIKGDELDVAGMTLVGLPLVIFGHNNRIAWGGTNLMADVQDLFIEQFNPSNPNQYRSGDTWLEVETRQEVIQVRAEAPASLRPALEPVIHNVRTTLRGPIVSDSLGVFEQPVSLSWSGLVANDTTYEAMLKVNYAQSWPAFTSALTEFTAPALNFLYADVAGNIGHQTAGWLPRRGAGEGMAILAGERPREGWLGRVPFADMPRVFNPESGFLYQANDGQTVVSDEVFISHDFADPARGERIRQLLQQNIAKQGGVTLESMQQMQTDVMDLSAAPVVALLTAVEAETHQQQAAIDALSQWQGQMHKDSYQATLFHVWTKYLRRNLVQSNLKDVWSRDEQRAQSLNIAAQIDTSDLPRLLNQPALWCGQESQCQSLVLQSLDQAISEIEKFFGDDVQDWFWGDMQHTYYQHTPFSQVKMLNVFFERQQPAGGSPNSINVASSTFNKSEGYRKTFGAGFRFVIDMAGKAPNMNYINSVGQSGHFLSDHYDDMIPLFDRGELLTLGHPDAPKTVLTLLPRQPQL